MTDVLLQRLLDRFIPEPNSGCWLWTESVNRYGYGYISFKQRKVLAHRATYATMVGPIPAGMYVCHKCDVPSCINPAHLFAGTPTDNARDMGRKGRMWKGRLRAPDVLNIRASALSDSELAAVYGVHRTTIGHVRNRFTWRTI